MIARGLSRYRALPSIHCRQAIASDRREGDLGLGPLQPIGQVEGRELRPLVGIQDLGRAKLVDRLVQRLEAEVRLPSP